MTPEQEEKVQIAVDALLAAIKQNGELANLLAVIKNVGLDCIGMDIQVTVQDRPVTSTPAQSDEDFLRELHIAPDIAPVTTNKKWSPWRTLFSRCHSEEKE